MVLIADEQEIHAHKAVLSACSPYFHAMFTCELAESSSDRITLQEVDGYALAQLVDFVYTSEIQVTEENVQASVDSHLSLTVLLYFVCDLIGAGYRPCCLLLTYYSSMKWRMRAVTSYSRSSTPATVSASQRSQMYTTHRTCCHVPLNTLSSTLGEFSLYPSFLHCLRPSLVIEN